MTENRAGFVSAVETTFAVLEGIHDLEGATVTELAASLDRPKSTVFKHLDTLRELGYVKQVDSEYVVGQKFSLIAESGKLRDDLYTTARPFVDQLTDTTEEAAGLYVLEDGVGIDLYRAITGEPTGEIRFPQLSRDLHCTAPGKAILAAMDRSIVESHLDGHGLPQRTPHTITDRESLFDELDRIRKQGIAFDREEQTEGLRSLAVTLGGEGESEVTGAVYILGLSARLTGKRFEEDLPGMLMNTVNQIEDALD